MSETAPSARFVFPGLEGFSWGRLGNPTLTPGQIADRGRRSLRRLREWDVRIPPGCRLERATALLESTRMDFEGMRNASDDLMARIAEGARTILELHTATHAAPRRPSEDVLRKLAVAITGSDLPGEEATHGARDTQFELLVWGLMRAGGLASCHFDESPDLRLDYGDEPVGIAAKRIWSPDQARKRLSHAADQIAASGIRGFIAVNAQEYLSAEAALGDDLAEKGAVFNHEVRRLHGHLPYIAKKPHVIGLIVCGTAVGWHRLPDGRPKTDLSSYFTMIGLADSPEDEAFASAFMGDLRDRLTEWMAYNL
jgi:hypothetical protein